MDILERISTGEHNGFARDVPVFVCLLGGIS